MNVQYHSIDLGILVTFLILGTNDIISPHWQIFFYLAYEKQVLGDFLKRDIFISHFQRRFCLLNSRGRHLKLAFLQSDGFCSVSLNVSVSLMKLSNFHRKSGNDFAFFCEDKGSMCPPAQCVCIKPKVSSANTWGLKYQ